jgi:hypothetical protein
MAFCIKYGAPLGDSFSFHSESGTSIQVLPVTFEALISVNEKHATTTGDFGDGDITSVDGRVWEGEFEDGELNGKGKVTFPDGEIWEGNFIDSELNGKGKI